MASGDVSWFQQVYVDLMLGRHDLSGDTVKAALITSAITPTAADPLPHFGGTGTTNYATAEVSGGTSYVAGGQVLASKTVTLVATKGRFDSDDTTWALDASGPTNARWSIVYNDTDANNRALFFVDLGEDLSLQAAPIVLTKNVSGILEIGAP